MTTIDPATSLANVELVVGDLDAQAGFYRDAIGLRELRRANGIAELGAPDGRPSARDAHRAPRCAVASPWDDGPLPSRAPRPRPGRARPRAEPGYGDRTAVHRRVRPSRVGGPLPRRSRGQRHRDLPRPAARGLGARDGQLQMATLPLDVEGVLASAPSGDTGEGMAAGTTLGHVHLQVASIPEADTFYTDGIGFDAMVRGYPGALFVSAGGYHHHVGLNTWAGEGAPPPPPGARGLRSYTIVLPDEAALEATLAAVAARASRPGRTRTGVRSLPIRRATEPCWRRCRRRGVNRPGGRFRLLASMP